MNWDQIEDNLEAWAAALKLVQNEASAALQSGSDDEKNAAKSNALAFIDHSPGLVDGVDQLDRLAAETVIDINNSDIQAALGHIEARSAQITAITKSIARVTATANSAAKSIALGNISSLIGNLTSVVSQAKKVKKALDDEGLHGTVSDELGHVPIKGLCKSSSL